MTWIPFICLGCGFLVAWKQLPEKIMGAVDITVNAALILLMLTIGMNIGINQSVMNNLGSIGINCAVISLFAIGGSIFFVLVVERTLLPLDAIREKLYKDKLSLTDEIKLDQGNSNKTSPLVWIMPVSIVAGVLAGYLLMSEKQAAILDVLLIASLILLYTGVGISLGENKKVFRYVKVLGFRILYISLAILAGSIAGGILSGKMLGIPAHISVISASGMSYYSITGAYMASVYGIEAGTYGFVVNVMREFFTVLLLPFIVRVSKGSPIAAGAAGCMDTMLVPVTKFVGVELGLVALVTGVILTFVVPILLPILSPLLIIF